MVLDLAKKLEFLNSKPRFKALFLLLLRAEDYVKSEELAHELNVTSRTVKNDIQNLKAELEKTGIPLISKRSKGYKLAITDLKLENELKGYFQIYQSETIDSEYDLRVQYIVRRLLSTNAFVKLETIQNELASTNPLTKEIYRVKKIVSDYGLYFRVRPHYGVKIEGAEFRKIMLIIRLYKYFNKTANPDFGILTYNALFFCDPEEKKRLRKVFYKTMTHSRVVFSDINAERFFVYLLYFRNQVLGKNSVFLDLPNIEFDFRHTEEFVLVLELLQKLKNQFKGFDFSDEIIEFLTNIAVISSDLYRFRDCTKENYDTLLEFGEETRNFLFRRLSEKLQIDVFDDYTCMKDLLKIMIPIGLKIKWNVSDSVDLGYEKIRMNDGEPLLQFFMAQIYQEFTEKYGYHFSRREQHMIFSTFLGMLNRIVLTHRKLKLAIIAIDGRLSTQQLKFNLKRYFSEYIEHIETRVLYELDFSSDRDYDYYLCANYGKNMNIQYRPIYFAEENMTEFEYVDSLRHIFLEAYDYDEILPPIHFEVIPPNYKFQSFPVMNFFQEGMIYERMELSGKMSIHIYLNLCSKQEEFQIFSYEAQEANTEFYLKINLMIAENKQKLRMLLNILNRLAENPEKLAELYSEKNTSYGKLFL
ncbi:HTH domain-containing protein [Listeria kieliensis]|uniref:HTH domain-containing protein n=1 Tax=Listeria kieliensis TaxID=1621700 RepID=UPI000E21283A|nr:HTH domain-containing protein [Listeria kieliensis]